MGVKGDRKCASAELGRYRSAHGQKRYAKHQFVQKNM